MKSTGKGRRAPCGRLKSDADKGLAERALHLRDLEIKDKIPVKKKIMSRLFFITRERSLWSATQRD
jgi:hypothetical protein